MGNKNILIITGHFHPDNSADSYLLTELAEDLIGAGFNVNVLTRMPSYNTRKNAPKFETHNGIEIERIASTRMNRQNIFLRTIDNFSFLSGLMLKSLKYKDKIILTNTMPFAMPLMSGLLNLIRRQKYILISYEVLPELSSATGVFKKNNIFCKGYGWAMKKVLERASVVIAIGEDMKNVLGKKIKKDKIKVISNWSDSKKFFPCKSKEFIKKYNIDGKFAIQYSGNIGRLIDIEPILSAAYELRKEKEIFFMIVGEGVQLNSLKEKVNNLGLKNFVFVPYLEKEKLNSSINSSDVSLINLKKGCEGFVVSSKLYPIMACGKPVIAIMDKNSDGAKTVLNSKSGFVVEDGKSLAEKILFLYKNKKKTKTFGENSRRYFLKHFERKLSTQKYISLLNKLF